MVPNSLEAGPRMISVSGEAEVKVSPDRVQLWLVIDSSDKSLEKAKKDHDERAKRTLAVTQKLGIEPKHVQTDFLTVTPSWNDYSRRTSVPDYYRVTKSVVVTLQDVTRFEELVSALLEAGAHRVEGFQFMTSELRLHRDRARALALKAAQQKAAAMAGELGLKAGKARTINEAAGSFAWGSWRGSGRGAMSQNVSQNAGGAEESPSEEGFALGQISVRATVHVTFDLEDPGPAGP